MVQRLLPILILLMLVGCQSAYYGALEKVGIHKRDIMVDRVEDARDSQQSAKQEFSSALERFQFVVGKTDSPLEQKYEELNDAFERSEAAAKEVSDRIESVRDVSEALFEEWENELGQYTSQSLRQQSAQKLRDTRNKYDQLMRSMSRVERSMTPVINAFRDQVLYLKHNLNAQAIDGLKNELSSVKSNVSTLINHMEEAIADSESFLAQLK